MDCCAHGYEATFDDAQATKDLKRFRKEGPDPTTRALIDMLRARGVQGATLLDIGGGVGAVHHELLDAGAQRATHVDGSRPYLRVAQSEAERRGHGERVEFVAGDFVEAAARLPGADVVTLDRVICCYPDMEALVAASASRARKLYGAVYPRDRWFLRIGLRLINLWHRIERNPFRTYLHSPAAIDAAIRRQGLTPAASVRTFVWNVAVYLRSSA